jgi:chemotaxis receptor (MCP) glutamine deamidase CheD
MRMMKLFGGMHMHNIKMGIGLPNVQTQKQGLSLNSAETLKRTNCSKL